ncbi:hypothetical protein LRS10_20445 [Phenylobacterium sp. J426]|uniref:hypothetical protein n=1 Tax=Phenylobacterium sp. J426 TaxID=2898439 RepID=UPI002151EB7B|nr:hypothetical protein [Phenylobacterium sp. J426]MCR5876307.1 hypothetical protein [Phenylobacterium sp. J426]
MRLARRGVKSWRPGRRATVVLGETAGALKGAIRRMAGRDLGQLVARLDLETGAAAEDSADAGRIGGFARALLSGLGAAAHSYLLRQGWREGRLGLIVALLSGLYPVLIQLRAADLLATREAEAARLQAQPLRLRQAAG